MVFVLLSISKFDVESVHNMDDIESDFKIEKNYQVFQDNARDDAEIYSKENANIEFSLNNPSNVNNVFVHKTLVNVCPNKNKNFEQASMKEIDNQNCNYLKENIEINFHQNKIKLDYQNPENSVHRDEKDCNKKSINFKEFISSKNIMPTSSNMLAFKITTESKPINVMKNDSVHLIAESFNDHLPLMESSIIFENVHVDSKVQDINISDKNKILDENHTKELFSENNKEATEKEIDQKLKEVNNSYYETILSDNDFDSEIKKCYEILSENDVKTNASECKTNLVEFMDINISDKNKLNLDDDNVLKPFLVDIKKATINEIRAISEQESNNENFSCSETSISEDDFDSEIKKCYEILSENNMKANISEGKPILTEFSDPKICVFENNEDIKINMKFNVKHESSENNSVSTLVKKVNSSEKTSTSNATSIKNNDKITFPKSSSLPLNKNEKKELKLNDNHESSKNCSVSNLVQKINSHEKTLTSNFTCIKDNEKISFLKSESFSISKNEVILEDVTFKNDANKLEDEKIKLNIKKESSKSNSLSTLKEKNISISTLTKKNDSVLTLVEENSSDKKASVNSYKKITFSESVSNLTSKSDNQVIPNGVTLNNTKNVKDYLEDERDDIINPEWEVVKNLSTNEERYLQVRKCWRSRTIPDPNKNLTYHSYRKRQFNSADQEKRTIRQHKRSASDSLHGKKAKRLCTFFIDEEINSIEKTKNQKKQEIFNEMHKKIISVDEQYFQNERLMLNENYGYNRNDELRNRYENRVYIISNEYNRMANSCEETFHQQLQTLEERRKEILKFFRFYKGLSDSNEDPSFLTETQFQELNETEDLYRQFNQYYGN